MRPSPQLTGSRWFSLLLAVLLVTSLAAPFMAGPVVAEEDDDGLINDDPEQICQTNFRYALPISCTEWIDDPVETESDEAMMHATAVAEGEGMDAHYIQLDNHLTDTNTIASLEARNAIAEAWEAGETEGEAYQRALEAIRDYYAIQQENHIEQHSKATVQLANVAHAAQEDSEIENEWLSSDGGGGWGNADAVWINGETDNATAELVNGETHNYTAIRLEGEWSAGGSYSDPSGTVTMDFLDADRWTWDDEYELETKFDPISAWDSNDAETERREFETTFTVTTLNVGDVDDGGLPSETVYDNREFLERWEEIEQQSDQMVGNYNTDFVADLYAELDAGNLDPEDVRGAEGMARYLSGDSNVTDQRFQLAMMQMGGMSNPDLAGTSSMTVEYEGYTDIRYNGTDTGERVPELSGYTEGTYEGLLFASEVPSGGFEVNQTYAVGDVNLSGTDLEPVNGSVQVFDSTEGETTHFYEGTFSVTEMYDADGEQVESVEWDDPQYDTYNASEFAAYIEEVQDLREAINEQAGDGDDGISIGLPDLEDIETGEALVGLVIIVVVAMAIIGLVTDLLPWF